MTGRMKTKQKKLDVLRALNFPLWFLKMEEWGHDPRNIDALWKWRPAKKWILSWSL
jgi:hypothetical protein